MDEYLVDIEKCISNIDMMYAHTPSQDSDKNPEKLMEHLMLAVFKLQDFNKIGGCFSYIRSLIRDILLDTGLFKNEELDNMEDFLFKAVINTVYLHDIGKCNVAYQTEIVKNEVFRKYYTNGMNTNHSLYSSKIFLDIMFDEALNVITNNNIGIIQRKINEKLWVTRYILIVFANCIVSHHSKIGAPKNLAKHLIEVFGAEEDGKIERLANPPELFNYTYTTDETVKIQCLINDPLKYKRITNILKPSAEKMYVLTKLIYSIICLTDTLATTDYMNGVTVSPAKLNIEEAITKFRQDEDYNKVMYYKETGKIDSIINAARSDMFIESEANLIKNINKNIFYLEAPTGGGKTKMATNIALKIIELTSNTKVPITRLLYTAPFNSITTQTADVLTKLLDNNFVDITTVNCDTPISVKDSQEEFKYQLSLLDNQMLNYPITLTSHVKLFQALFGISRTDNHMLLNLINSVVVIDEIQAYNPSIWVKMIRLIDVYAKYLNIKFIIMSATLPKIGKLINKNRRCSEYVELIDNCEKYFEKECFKRRVDEYNYSLLDSLKPDSCGINSREEYRDLIFNAIIYKIKWEFKQRGKCKILVEFISKKSANLFYKKIKGMKDKIGADIDVREFTGDTGIYSRRKTIKMANEKDRNLIIVATQCIEAGVNISMNVGFKDISYIDSEEQIAGRLDRHFSKESKTILYFFNMDNADAIYGKDISKFKRDMTVADRNYRQYLENKNYRVMFDDMIKKMCGLLNSSDVKTGIWEFDNKLKELDYKSLKKELELIPERDEIMLFFPINIEIEEDNVIKIINGDYVWNELKNALSVNDYAENKVKASKARVETSYFCYKFSLPGNAVKNNNIEDMFKEILRVNHISYTQMVGLFRLDISDEQIKHFIDYGDDYRFDRDNFSTYLGIK